MRSLHARLALALLGLLVLAGALNLHSTLRTTELYLQEVNQRVNFNLASHIARMTSSRILSEEGRIRRQGLGEVLHWMKVFNPGPFFYLLNLEGEVLAYDKAAGEILDRRVSLGPIREFFKSRSAPAGPDTAVLGDDPRDPENPKIFSAATIPPDGPPRGYLYIVLATEDVASAADRLRTSYILRLSTPTALAYVGVVLLVGWLLFRGLTRPLRALAGRMRELPRKDPDRSAGAGRQGRDEVGLLERTFDDMSRRIERQMAEIETMARTRRELIANVSHDLRTPIAMLRGYLDTLALEANGRSAEEEEYLEIAVRQGERLSKLVNELFELTRLDAREVEPRLEHFQIAELVQDNVQKFRLRAKQEDVRLDVDFDPALPPVVADIGLMERVLENLLDNALTFSGPSGRVRVTLRERTDRLRIEIADNGCGIPEEDLPHIFDRYYRSREKAGAAPRGAGLGLGLAIVQKILELHRSRLEIDSRPGDGTTVSFELETLPPPAAP
jgi:signal transduction histidine kinase